MELSEWSIMDPLYGDRVHDHIVGVLGGHERHGLRTTLLARESQAVHSMSPEMLPCVTTLIASSLHMRCRRRMLTRMLTASATRFRRAWPTRSLRMLLRQHDLPRLPLRLEWGHIWSYKPSERTFKRGSRGVLTAWRSLPGVRVPVWSNIGGA